MHIFQRPTCCLCMLCLAQVLGKKYKFFLYLYRLETQLALPKYCFMIGLLFFSRSETHCVDSYRELIVTSQGGALQMETEMREIFLFREGGRCY